MDKTTKLVAVITVVIAAAIGAAVYFANQDNETDATSDATNRSANDEQAENEAPTNQTDPDAEHAATITFTNAGFSIDQSTVKAGDTVLVVNTADRPLDFSSDPHPTHSDQDDLNVGVIRPGESRTFTVTEQGTWGYHDHNDPALSGSITVE